MPSATYCGGTPEWFRVYSAACSGNSKDPTTGARAAHPADVHLVYLTASYSSQSAMPAWTMAVQPSECRKNFGPGKTSDFPDTAGSSPMEAVVRRHGSSFDKNPPISRRFSCNPMRRHQLHAISTSRESGLLPVRPSLAGFVRSARCGPRLRADARSWSRNWRGRSRGHRRRKRCREPSRLWRVRGVAGRRSGRPGR